MIAVFAAFREEYFILRLLIPKLLPFCPVGGFNISVSRRVAGQRLRKEKYLVTFNFQFGREEFSP
jgi:hypothetical protein